jgi:hypothetical protein
MLQYGGGKVVSDEQGMMRLPQPIFDQASLPEKQTQQS